MKDIKTDHLNLPLPNLDNALEDDCPRIVEAFRAVDAHAAAADGRLDDVEERATALEGRASSLEGRASAAEAQQTATDMTLTSHTGLLAGLENSKASRTELEQAEARQEAALEAQADAQEAALGEEAATRALEMAAHDASLTCHDSLVKRITVGSLSPIVGICCVEEGGGSGLWFNIDADGQPMSPTRRYFDYHPVYNALKRVLVDGQIMEQHSKFYYKAFEIASGPFAGRRGRLICPGQQDGFKPFPSFMLDGQEIDCWYCGTYQATNEGGSPVKAGSRPGKAPLVNVNFATMQSYCRNRNADGVSGFDMWDIYQAAEIQLLATIEAGTPDSQAVYGEGRVNTSSAANVDALDVATATWRGHVGLWGNVWQMCNGLDVTTAGKVRLWKNDGSKEFVETDFTCPAYDGSNYAFMQTLKSGSGEGYDWDDIFFPATTTTNAALGTIPDGFWGRSGSAGNVLYLGAYWNFAGRAGLFACGLGAPASDAGTSVGCRLAKR